MPGGVWRPCATPEGLQACCRTVMCFVRSQRQIPRNFSGLAITILCAVMINGQSSLRRRWPTRPGLPNTKTHCPPPPLAAARRIRPRRCGVVRSADIAARGVPPDAVVSGLPPLGTNPSAHGSSIWAVEVQGRRALHVHLLPSSIIYAVVQSQQSG